MKNQIIQYIKNKHGNPIGVLVAVKVNDKVNIGWSLCCKSDEFTKAKGKQIAFGRANHQYQSIVPHSIKDQYNNFNTRCFNEFNTAPTVKPVRYNPVAEIYQHTHFVTKDPVTNVDIERIEEYNASPTLKKYIASLFNKI